MDNISTTVKVALASAVGLGLGYVAYRTLSSYSKSGAVLVSNEESGLKGKRVFVLGVDEELTSRLQMFLNSGANVVLSAPPASINTETKTLIDKYADRVHIESEFNENIIKQRSPDLVLCLLKDAARLTSVADLCRELKVPLHIAYSSEEAWDTITDQPFTPEDKNIPEVMIGIFDGYTASKYVGHGFSDVFYDFSYNEDAAHLALLPHDFAQKHEHTINLAGESVKVKIMDIRAGSGSALTGTLTSEIPTKANAYTPSSALPDMVPAIYDLVKAGKGCVIHTGVCKLSDDLSIEPSFDDVLAVQHTGAVVIGSYSPQEVHDIGFISQIASQQLSTPFVHFFDAKTVARESSSVRVLSRNKAKIAIETISGFRDALDAKGKPKRKAEHVADVITHVMDELTADLDNKYSLHEYVGSQAATHIIVAVGPDALYLKDTVTSFLTTSPSCEYGAVIVRMLHPWSASRFLSVLPATCRRIAVLGPIYAEVAASFHMTESHVFSNLPSVTSIANPTSQDVTPSVIQSIFVYIKQDTAAHINLPISADVVTRDHLSLVPSLAAPASVRGEIWDLPRGKKSEIINKLSSFLLHTDLHTSTISTTALLFESEEAPLRKPTVTQVQISAAPLTTVDRFSPVDYIMVYDHTLLEKYNVFANLKAGGSLIIQCPWSTPEQIDEKLRVYAKREIAGRRLNVYIFDPTKLASQEEDGADIREAAFIIYSGLYEILGGMNAVDAVLHKAYKHNATALAAAKVLQQRIPIQHQAAWMDAALDANEPGPFPKPKLLLKAPESHSLRPQMDHVGEAAKYLMFTESYQTKKQLRPDVSGSYLVKVDVNRRLTPADYDRNVFHIEFDTNGTDLKYEIGDALGVYGHNDEQEVLDFLKYYGLDPDSVLSLPFKGAAPGVVHARTLRHIFTQYLDLFGRPAKQFYQQIAEYATDVEEKKQLLLLTTPEGQELYKARVDQTVTFADILLDFPSARPPLDKLMEFIPPIKPRHYSIASSMKMHPNSVHLLVVLVSWEVQHKEQQKTRFGHCTRYLVGLKPGQLVTVSIKPSVMRLPPMDTQPIVMAGLGTGMAPFRAFIEERAVLKRQGVEVGPIALYFGSRSRFAEYLYGEELEAYNKEGLLTYLRLAFSRDQPEKIYIQHKIEEDKKELWQMLAKSKGHFYLCGPTWPEPDVKKAILDSFTSQGNLSPTEAEGLLEEMRSNDQYILELY
eukprot:TRINITY_DN689_c0_g1_i5.p1 TRINITY_DN689_c0_g1~~TRINITY_DN689_c0_g1_i5.p1  ORF type:complete len:1208 (+),score=338.40 TRINITY_DN689_c0_g1_i5:237-3860(+)